MVNVSTDFSSLNIFSSSFLHLLQIRERTNVFSKVYDILVYKCIMYGFSGFLYLPQIMQYNFFTLTLLVMENVLVLFYHSFHIHWEKINLYNLANFYLLT